MIHFEEMSRSMRSKDRRRISSGNPSGSPLVLGYKLDLEASELTRVTQNQHCRTHQGIIIILGNYAKCWT
ncbi:hypothetical protein RvY_00448 [Ramazzottius varieornatus]|uniref:Uncharacterized protein n=1 Tax=Ramazzottius varieornatus TaxID=947166 RepID=A0A1D1UCU0_RAMVA|nr:hypothetical protein RvY_00448 [Ramazzottius varieornatus]